MAQNSGWDKDTSPYHPGEQELHDRLGIKDRQEAIGRRVHRSYMIEQHRQFFHQLPYLLVGSIDQNGSSWASILFGNPGFVTTPTDRKIKVQAVPIQGDPLAENIVPGMPIGFLGLETQTRRRNRLNGVVTSSGEDGLLVDVVQSFGNCPQYINTRALEFIRDRDLSKKIEPERLETLDEEAIGTIQSADTMFVASHNNQDDICDTGGVDVNHRGGQPGFVKVEANVLTIPDYVGNFAFNTLGNFLINPQAGLLFVDFKTGDILTLTGTTEVIWDKTPEVVAMRGAERAWRFKLDYGLRMKQASPLRQTLE